MTPIFVSRLTRLDLVDGDGAEVGRMDDVVITPTLPGDPPEVLGFVVQAGRRRVFMAAGRVSEISPTGVRMVKGSVDYRRFAKREGELLVRGDLFGKRLGSDMVADLGIVNPPGTVDWEVDSVALAASGLLRRRISRVVHWDKVPELFDTGRRVHRRVAALRELHPSDAAEQVSRMPLAAQRELAEAMEDETLADLLEELPEDEQIRLIQNMKPDRIADILEEMEADDAADLLGELPAPQRESLLKAMEPDEARALRRLLSYEATSAGGLMTPEPIMMPPEATVAEALARIRESEIPAVLANNVFVVNPPLETPTGTYVGIVGFQRLLRVPPSMAIGDLLGDDEELDPIHPSTPAIEVARTLAAYDGVAIPVCDDRRRLLGAVTVDDVLDRLLPVGWRRRR